MKLKIVDARNEKTGEVVLPVQFSEPVRDDLIQRAVLAVASAGRVPYGAFPAAGTRASAKLSRRRKDYRGSYGHGISRVPRKILSRRGTQMSWVGAFAPGTVKGRMAHPPKSSKQWVLKINRKERRKAVRSALAAVVDSAMVAARGHRIPKDYPFAVDDSFESISRAKDVVAALGSLGFADELARCSVRHLRAGKGRSRGRRYKLRAGPLLVVSKDCSLLNAASNIPGVDVAVVSSLNACLLAPGASKGRVTLFTKSALSRLSAEKLFM